MVLQHSLKEQHHVNNSWQLKGIMITVKHKDNPPFSFPPSLSEMQEEQKGIKVKTGIKICRSYTCSFEFMLVNISSVQ